MTMRKFLAMLFAALLFLGACSSDDDSSDDNGDDSSEQSSDDSGDDSSDSGDDSSDDSGDSDIGSEECDQLTEAMDQLDAASTGTGELDLTEDEFDEIIDSAPEEIQDDLAVMSETLAELEGTDPDSLDALEIFSDSGYLEAAGNVTGYILEACLAGLSDQLDEELGDLPDDLQDQLDELDDLEIPSDNN